MTAGCSIQAIQKAVAIKTEELGRMTGYADKLISALQKSFETGLECDTDFILLKISCYKKMYSDFADAVQSIQEETEALTKQFNEDSETLSSESLRITSVQAKQLILSAKNTVAVLESTEDILKEFGSAVSQKKYTDKILKLKKFRETLGKEVAQ